MCLYKLLITTNRDEFFCLIFREDMTTPCPLRCPFFVECPDGQLARFPYDKACLHLRLRSDEDGARTAYCVQTMMDNPKCSECTFDRDYAPSLFSLTIVDHS